MILRRLSGIGAVVVLVATALPVPLAAAASTVCVEVVVDYGNLYNNKVSASCVVVPSSASGADVLAARAKKLDVPPPRYRADGLLCAIDGMPKSPDCAEQTDDGGFKYWSYWHKQQDSGWKYAQSGPFDYTMTGSHPGEGWSWVEGTEKNSRPPANVRYSRVCPLTTPAPKPSVTKSARGDPATSSAVGRSGSSRPGGRALASATAPAAATPPASAAASALTTPAATPSEVAIADPPHTGEGGGTSLVGFGLGAALIAGLGGAAFWRTRRTSPT